MKCGVTLIDGKYIPRLSEEGNLYLEIVFGETDISDVILRETENGDQYYEPVRYPKYYNKLGNEIDGWEREDSVQYYDESGNEVEMLLEECDEEEDFNWLITTAILSTCI